MHVVYKPVLILLLIIGIVGCTPQDRRSVAPPPPPTVEAGPEWERVRAVLDSSELTDFVVLVGTANGPVFSYSKGRWNETSPAIPIASASKWWTAATILSLVEEGSMALDDNPQKYISWWTSDPADPRSQITLEHLIAMTAGFQGEPPCVNNQNMTLEECGRSIHDNYHRDQPGTTFFYSSAHMHIAGLMATLATGETFADIFRRTISEPLRMRDSSNFQRASVENPWLAGGGASSPLDYARFQQALLSGAILPNTRHIMFADHTADPVNLLFSPVQSLTEWHYGLGVWLECSDTTWTEACPGEMMYSSGGGLGWFPWIDMQNGYYGLVARRGLPLTGALGPSVELAFELRPLIIETLQNTGGG